MEFPSSCPPVFRPLSFPTSSSPPNLSYHLLSLTRSPLFLLHTLVSFPTSSFLYLRPPTYFFPFSPPFFPFLPPLILPFSLPVPPPSLSHPFISFSTFLFTFLNTFLPFTFFSLPHSFFPFFFPFCTSFFPSILPPSLPYSPLSFSVTFFPFLPPYFVLCLLFPFLADHLHLHLLLSSVPPPSLPYLGMLFFPFLSSFLTSSNLSRSKTHKQGVLPFITELFLKLPAF